MSTMTYTGTLVVCSCWCGIQCAVPRGLYDQRMREKELTGKSKAIWCPIGHEFIYTGESRDQRVARLERQLANTDEDLRAARARLSIQKAQTTKARNKLKATERRVAHGVCPCCQRSFKQLRRHMEGQHPTFVIEHGIPEG
jgi:hypothetical protein